MYSWPLRLVFRKTIACGKLKENTRRPDAVSRFKFGRRQLLKVGAASAGAGLLLDKWAGAPPVARDGGTCGSPDTTPFGRALTEFSPEAAGGGPHAFAANHPWRKRMRTSAAPTMVGLPGAKILRTPCERCRHSFHRELPPQPIWGYDGTLPRPTFVARYKEPVIVLISNELPLGHIGFGSPEISTRSHNVHAGSESYGFTGDY